MDVAEIVETVREPVAIDNDAAMRMLLFLLADIADSQQKLVEIEREWMSIELAHKVEITEIYEDLFGAGPKLDS